MNKPKLSRREIRFAIHIPANKYTGTDLHYIKEHLYFDDGTDKPNITMLKDFQRPVWITHPKFRNHEEKKEFEDIDKLIKLETTQSNINLTVAKALDQQHLFKNPTELKKNPYIYGYDLSSTSYLKLRNLMKNDFIQSPYTVAAFDIETNILTGEIIIASVVMKGKVYTAVLNKYLNGSIDVHNRTKKAIDLYLPKYSDIDFKMVIFETEVQLLKAIFKIATDWSPDFLTIWNMDYDIPFILDRLKLFNVNPSDVLSDYRIPKANRMCFYKQGIKKRVTASGVVKPIRPAAQWHTLVNTAPFYVIDSMCVYRELRSQSQQEEASYSLDAILKKEGIGGKLRFKEADHLSGAAWHNFMVENYPIEYIVYNIYDCLSMLELDDKLKDLSTTVPSFAGITDFNRFNSNPKKIVDAMFKFSIERGRVMGTVGKKDDKKIDDGEDDDTFIDDDDDDVVENVNDYETLDLKSWIITLPQHLLYANGLKCISESDAMMTNIRGMVYDTDVSSSYPTCTLVANVSKETTENELISIGNIKETVFREQNLGIIAGSVNAIDYCNKMFGLPTLEEIDQLIV